MNVAWDLFWGGSRSRKHCAFPYKVAAGGDEGYLVSGAGAAGVVSRSNGFPWCSATCGCSGVRISMRLLNFWLQIAVYWLHDCCQVLLPRG